MTRWKVQLFELNYDEREERAAMEVLAGRWITMGEKTIAFENRFAEFLGEGTEALAVSSGTAALHLALLALGLGPGDEVIIPGLTFVADLNVVEMAGATPVLADCASLEDWNIDPTDIAAKISPRTRAVMIMHYAGFPCDVERIVALCRERGLHLIEDAAHAVGASRGGRRCGTFGDVAAFSFFTNKNLSVGEGGMFVARSEALGRRGRNLRSHGMSTLTLDRHLGRAISYDVIEPGLNYRLDEIRAAIGLVQLEKLPEANARRRMLTERYRRGLAGVPDLVVPFRAPRDDVPAYHIFPVLLPSEDMRLRAIERLRDEGIQTSIHYPDMHRFHAYAGRNLGATPRADEISRREMTLPLYPTMSLEAVDLVIEAVRRALSAG